MSSTQLRVGADLESIREIGPWLHTQCDDVDLCSRLELALQELAANIVRHGYGPSDAPNGGSRERGIVAEWITDGDLAQVVVTDWAPPYEAAPHRQAQPGVPRVHGYGLLIIEQIVDQFTYERIADRNVWTLRFAS